MEAITFSTTTEAGLSDPFYMDGSATKIKVDGLTDAEWMELHEEDAAGGTYSPVLVKGKKIILNPQQPSDIFNGVGNYCLYKSETAAARVAGYESA